MVYAHALEFPYLRGVSRYPPMDPVVGGGIVACMSRFFPRGPIDLGSRLLDLPPDGSVPYLTDWKWVHCPGHTPGHVALFRELDRTLIAGGAFVTAKQESGLALFDFPHKIYNPPAYATTDWPAAFRSVNLLAQLDPDVAATGHGRPVYGESLRRGLEKLGGYWDGFIPSRGRYVKEPAIADEKGLHSVPPAVVDLKLIVYSTVGLAALGAGTYWWMTRRNRWP